MAGDRFSQTSLNGRYCLISEVITVVVDTTAKYSLCSVDFASYKRGVLKYFKNTAQENPQSPLNISK